MKEIIKNRCPIIYIIIVFVLAYTMDLKCQMSNNEIIIPPSTTANKFENSNIYKPNLYNGTNNTYIPIYEITIKDFKIPIALTHNYNGFKPGETSSWVGLGWNLNAGGCISRIVMNKPDEHPDGGYNQIRDLLNMPDELTDYSQFSSFLTGLTSEQLSMLAEGTWECQPDQFMISANDLSSKFIRLKNGKYVTIPFKPIQFTNQGSIKDESGHAYYFGSQNDGIGEEVSNTEISSSSDEGWVRIYNTTQKYLLRKIVMASGETITFNYEGESGNTETFDSESYSVPYQKWTINPQKTLEPISSNSHTMITRGTVYRLSSIVTPNENIFFKKGQVRKDMENGILYSLGEIEVKNKLDSIVKGWVFYTSYIGNSSNVNECRLVLDSIAEYGNSRQSLKPSYKFTYNKSTETPHYKTKSIDHWGYYNGAPNTTLIPREVPNSAYNDYFSHIWGNRESNHLYSQIGLLSKIELPTKGSVSFTYEPNSCGFIESNTINETLYDNIPLYINSTSGTSTGTLNLEYNQSVNIDLYMDPNTLYSGGSTPMDTDPMYIQIINTADGQIVYEKFETGEEITAIEKLFLNAGSYQVIATVQKPNQLARITIEYSKVRKDNNGNVVINKNKIVGGHRVSGISELDYITNTEVKKTFKYTVSTENDRSSGVLVGLPNYDYQYNEMNLQYLPYQSHPIQHEDILRISRSSNSIRAIASDDSHLSYSEISEVNSNNGQSILFFTSALDFPDIIFPKDVSNISKSYKRGLLTKKIDFDTSAREVARTENNYDFHNPVNKTGIWGIMIVDYEHKSIYPNLSTFKPLHTGSTTSEWIPLISETNVRDGVSTSKNYIYDNPVHAQPTRVKLDSNNEESYTYMLYADDYSDTGGGNFIGEMKNAHIINKPVEKVSYIKDKLTNSYYVTGGEVYTYKTGAQVGQLDCVYKLELKNPVLLSLFKFSNRGTAGEMPHANNSYGTFSVSQLDSRYSPVPEKKVVSYDSNNNPRELMFKNNLIVTYLWSYNNQYPIAEIKNATYSEVVGALSGITPEQLGSASEPDMAKVEALRHHPGLLKAQVTTYTYKPLVGILTATDPRGVTTHYEYDTLNRLMQTYIIENGEKKILQKYDYHYANQ